MKNAKKKVHTDPKRGKLISLKKLEGDYDITMRRLKNVCEKEEIEIHKAMVQTAGGPQVADAVYSKDIAKALKDLKLPTVTKADVTYQEASAELEISLVVLDTEVRNAGFTMTRKLGTYDRGFYQPVRCITKAQLKKLKKDISNTLYAE